MVSVDYFVAKSSSIRYYIDIYDAFARALSNLKYCEHQGERMILFKKVGRVASSFNCAPSSDFTLQSSETYYVTDGVRSYLTFHEWRHFIQICRVRLLKIIARSVSSVQPKIFDALRQSIIIEILCGAVRQSI